MVVPPCIGSSRGVTVRPVSNLVSIWAPVPSGRGRLAAPARAAGLGIDKRLRQNDDAVSASNAARTWGHHGEAKHSWLHLCIIFRDQLKAETRISSYIGVHPSDLNFLIIEANPAYVTWARTNPESRPDDFPVETTKLMYLDHRENVAVVVDPKGSTWRVPADKALIRITRLSRPGRRLNRASRRPPRSFNPVRVARTCQAGSAVVSAHDRSCSARPSIAEAVQYPARI
jgi:hypothetical protein